MRNILILIILLTLVSVAGEHKANTKKESSYIHISFGKILQVQKIKGYTYLKVDQNGTLKWVTIANLPVKKGDIIGYDDRLTMKDFKSKALGKTFDEIIFATKVFLEQKVPQVESLQTVFDVPHETETVEKAPVKEFYTIEEIYRFRKSLAGKTVVVKAKVNKVSHQIMKRDWVHLRDGSGNEKLQTDELVFTAKKTEIKVGDHVIAKAKIVVDKDFGFGYFYRILGEEAEFIKE